MESLLKLLLTMLTIQDSAFPNYLPLYCSTMDFFFFYAENNSVSDRAVELVIIKRRGVMTTSKNMSQNEMIKNMHQHT